MKKNIHLNLEVKADINSENCFCEDNKTTAHNQASLTQFLLRQLRQHPRSITELSRLADAPRPVVESMLERLERSGFIAMACYQICPVTQRLSKFYGLLARPEVSTPLMSHLDLFNGVISRCEPILGRERTKRMSALIFAYIQNPHVPLALETYPVSDVRVWEKFLKPTIDKMREYGTY